MSNETQALSEYVTPEFEIITIAFDDIITTSNDPYHDGNHSGGGGFWDGDPIF